MLDVSLLADNILAKISSFCLSHEQNFLSFCLVMYFLNKSQSSAGDGSCKALYPHGPLGG